MGYQHILLQRPVGTFCRLPVALISAKAEICLGRKLKDIADATYQGSLFTRDVEVIRYTTKVTAAASEERQFFATGLSSVRLMPFAGRGWHLYWHRCYAKDVIRSIRQ